MIEVRNIHKSFGENHVLHDISLKFSQGKTNLIIGQSGSGKTVLLKTIIGLHYPTKGCILYDDRNFSKMSHAKKKEIRKEIGMVFQGGALFGSDTVLENVMFPLKMFSSMSDKEMIDRAEFCLERVNLTNVGHLYPSETSGGMQKRISIARAIVMKPKYLFFDEPNSGLDPKTAIVIDNLIKELTEDLNTVTVINTHDMNSVAEIGDFIHFIYKGRKWWTGNKSEIFETDNKELNDFVFATELMRKIKSVK
ncbi:MAG: ATP-binding cassette domain-containing protein [Bacteroidota bacterium]|nr:ATP-binding cassette domain-containing protein [Bacteroidota bacterium]